jgi:hypothetical protein
MARMFPNRIPKAVADDPRRGAERRVYDRLAATLDDGYAVFGWVPWLREGERGGLAEGEADFLVAHEQEGFLVLEIKGGRVSRDGNSGRWSSRDREGRAHEIHNPVQQAGRSMHSVLNRLKTMPGWEHRWIPSGYAVVMPDCERPARDLALDAPLRICAFAEDMANLGPCLRRILRGWTAEHVKTLGLGAEGVAALESLVAGSFELRAPLGPVLKDEDRSILELTEEQYRVLDALAGNPRVLVRGGAGTGKTMLAMEQARRLGRQGRRTLLTCFNRPLADYLRQSTGGREQVTILNFHQLCYQWARRAGLDAVDPDSPQAETQPETYFQQELPRLFLDALDRLDERFDSIVVDEGQDFLPDYWDVLHLAFADLTRATLHVFQDAAQDIYAARADALRGVTSYTLQENLRNTRQIHRVLQGLSADDRTVARGPAGVHPEWIAATADEQAARLAEVVLRLTGAEQVAPQDLAVLTTSRGDIARLAPDGRVGGNAITRDPLERSERVLVESIPRFKGLERRVVVLAGLRESRHGTLAQLLYVGASRARAHLVVIADEPTLARLRPPEP